MWDSPSSRPAVTMLDASTMLDIVDQIKLFLFYSRRHRHTTVDATKIMIDTIPVSARLIQTLSALKKLCRFLWVSAHLKELLTTFSWFCHLKLKPFTQEGRESLLLVAIRVIDSQGHVFIFGVKVDSKSGIRRDLTWLVIRIATEIFEKKSELFGKIGNPGYDRSEESCNYYLNWDVMKHGSNPMYDFHP